MRRGESLLLTIGIPVILLVFFSEVHLLPTGTAHPVTLPGPGHPGPGRHGHGARQPEHRHGLRARLRRAQAARRHPAGPPVAAGRQDRRHPRGRGDPGRGPRARGARARLAPHRRRRGTGRRGGGPRHRRVRGHRPAAGRRAARRGQPGRRQRAVAAAPSRERDAGPAVQVAGRAAGRGQGPARRRARRRAAPRPGPGHRGAGVGVAGARDVGRRPPPWPRRPRSDGNEPGRWG